MSLQLKPLNTPRPENFLLLHRSTLKREVPVLLFFLGLLFALRVNAVLSLSTHFLGGVERDAGLYIWLMRINMRDLFSSPWFNTAAFYPYGRSLAWSDNFILPSLAAIPLVKAGLPFVVTYNFIILSANFLNGYCTYRVAFKLTGAALPAVVGGASFMSYSFLTGHLGHPQLQFAFLVPCILSAIFSYFALPSWFRAIFAGFLVFLSFITAVYYAVFAVILVAALVLAFYLLRPTVFLLRESAKLALGAAIGLAPVVPFCVPYLDVRATFGGRGIYEAYYFAATALSYFSATPFNLLYGWTSKLEDAEAQLFPGVVVLLLVCLALRRLGETKKLRKVFYLTAACFVLTCLFSQKLPELSFFRHLCALSLWATMLLLCALLTNVGKLERKLGFEIITNRALIGSLVFCAFVFFAISLGPLGNPEKGHWALGIYSIMYGVIPGMDAIRAVSRAGIIVVLCSALIIPFFLVHIQEKKKWRDRFILLPLILILIENYCWVYPLEPLYNTPSVFAYLEEHAAPTDVVIVLPFASRLSKDGEVESWGEFAEKNVRYVNWAFPMQGKIVNGYSGVRTHIMRKFPRRTRNFPDKRSVEALSTIAGVRYIVFASGYAPEIPAKELERQLRELSGSLRLIERDVHGFMLFEFIEQIRLRDDYELLMPSFPAGGINFEVMALYEKGEPDVVIDLLLRTGEAEERLSPIKVKCDGEWGAFSVRLPATPERVRTRELRFKIPDGKKVFIRSSYFAGEGVLANPEHP